MIVNRHIKSGNIIVSNVRTDIYVAVSKPRNFNTNLCSLLVNLHRVYGPLESLLCAYTRLHMRKKKISRSILFQDILSTVYLWLDGVLHTDKAFIDNENICYRGDNSYCV